MDIHKTCVQMKEQQFPQSVIRDSEEHLNSILEKNIDKIVSSVLKNYKKNDKNRKNELKNNLRGNRIIFSCVGTPQSHDGSADIEQVLSVES